MDKSFNDQELSDIMKEIEALEVDFSDSEEESQNSVLEVLAQLDEEKAIPHSIEDVVPLESKRTSPVAHSAKQSSMSFKVQGNLTLDLQFEIGGKVMTLMVSEEALTIEMEGGVKFTVPVDHQSPLKKAC